MKLSCALNSSEKEVLGMSYCREWTEGDSVLYALYSDLLIPWIRFVLTSELSTLNYARHPYSWIRLSYMLSNAYCWSETNPTEATQ